MKNFRTTKFYEWILLDDITPKDDYNLSTAARGIYFICSDNEFLNETISVPDLKFYLNESESQIRKLLIELNRKGYLRVVKTRLTKKEKVPIKGV